MAKPAEATANVFRFDPVAQTFLMALLCATAESGVTTSFTMDTNFA